MKLRGKHIVFFGMLFFPFLTFAQNTVDTTAPILTLIGTDITKEASNEIYIDAGATAIDDLEGDISNRIRVGGDTVYGNIPGVYIVRYNVFDTAGNEAVEIIRTVTITSDATPPVITLIGAATVVLKIGTPYVEKGATVLDNLSKSLTVTIGGDIVNTNIEGTYSVAYNVVDASGNGTETVIRTVKVVDDLTFQNTPAKNNEDSLVIKEKGIKQNIEVSIKTDAIVFKDTSKNSKETVISEETNVSIEDDEQEALVEETPVSKIVNPKQSLDAFKTSKENITQKETNKKELVTDTNNSKNALNVVEDIISNTSEKEKIEQLNKNSHKKISSSKNNNGTLEELKIDTVANVIENYKEKTIEVVKSKAKNFLEATSLSQDVTTEVPPLFVNITPSSISENSFTAGNTLILEFPNAKNEAPYLYCSNSYGPTLILPNRKEKSLQYIVPSHISNKIGTVNWKVLIAEKEWKGIFNITPKDSVASMETYAGPPSINVGGSDHTMLVVIPTEDLDNPVKRGTPVSVNHQFLSNEEKIQVYTNKLIAYGRIYTEEKSGRFLISSSSSETNSKEFTIDAVPTVPENFTISAEQNHNYADGNQITTFSTSILKDKYGNVVSDGLYVAFFIKNKRGNILKTAGTTIKGIAIARIVHPDYEEEWTVKAYVEGMAESNTIKLAYNASIKDFNIAFSEENRKITIGPLQSFMNQIAPDGLQVQLTVYKNNQQIASFIKTSNKGYVNFYLKTDVVKSDTYEIRIYTSGIEKIIKEIKI